MITLPKIAMTALDLRSAPNSSVLITSRPLIVDALSNEAIKGFVSFRFIRVLQCLDDLIHPRMGIHQCSRKVFSNGLVMLRNEG